MTYHRYFQKIIHLASISCFPLKVSPPLKEYPSCSSGFQTTGAYEKSYLKRILREGRYAYSVRGYGGLIRWDLRRYYDERWKWNEEEEETRLLECR